jgi:hypothetical protein
MLAVRSFGTLGTNCVGDRKRIEGGGGLGGGRSRGVYGFDFSQLKPIPFSSNQDWS